MPSFVLQKQIKSLINGDNFCVYYLNLLLIPASTYIEDDIFFYHINHVSNIIIGNRHSNNLIRNLEILSDNNFAVTALGRIIVIIMSISPSVKFRFNTEEIMFKIIAYIFLILIPKKIDNVFSREDNNKIINILFDIHNTSEFMGIVPITTSNILKKKKFLKKANFFGYSRFIPNFEKYIYDAKKELIYQMHCVINDNSYKYLS